MIRPIVITGPKSSGKNALAQKFIPLQKRWNRKEKVNTWEILGHSKESFSRDIDHDIDFNRLEVLVIDEVLDISLIDYAINKVTKLRRKTDPEILMIFITRVEVRGEDLTNRCQVMAPPFQPNLIES